MTIDLSAIRFSYDDSRVVRAVQKHPRLEALLPKDLEELVRAYKTAQATAAAVSALKTETIDFADVVDADLRAGRQPDAADLVAKYAAAQREAAEIQAVAQQLSALPHTYRNDIIREVMAAADTMYEDLADQLDDVIDRGMPLVAALDGINTGDQAMDAERVDEWQAVKALAAEYADIREASLALARAEDSTNFSPGSVGVSLLFFAAVEHHLPRLDDPRGDQGPLVGFRREALAFDPTRHTDLGHFLYVLRNRNALQPHVVRPSEVSDRRAALYAEAQPDGVRPEPGRLAREYGGAEAAMNRSAMARQVRSAGAAQRQQRAMTGGLLGGRMEMDLGRGA